MSDDYEFRLVNLSEDRSLRGIYEVDDIDMVFQIWLHEVIQRPKCEHRVEAITTGTVLWLNDLNQPQYPERPARPSLIWIAAQEQWETPFMQKPDLWRPKGDADCF